MNAVMMKHQPRTRVPSRLRGVGQQVSAAQQAANAALQKAQFAFDAAQIADARAGLTSWSPTTLAAQQQLQTVTNQTFATFPPAGPAGVGVAQPASSVPYVIAGVLGVTAIGALIYFLTE